MQPGEPEPTRPGGPETRNPHPHVLQLRFIALAFVGLAWATFFTYVALENRPPQIPGISFSTTSLAGHFIVFGVATAWLYLLFRGGLRFGMAGSILLASVISLGLGVAVEVAQGTLTETRAFQRRDIAADVLGTAVVAAIIVLSHISFTPLRAVAIAVVAASIATVAATMTVVALWNPDYPYRGDHWHAQYLVVVCGERQPAFDPFPGAVHSHGATLIHIHPTSAENSGANANMGLFFENAGGELRDDGIRMPDGREFSNGDSCPGQGTGELTMHLLDVSTRQRIERLRSPADYVPRQGDTLVIEFGSEPFDFSLNR